MPDYMPHSESEMMLWLSNFSSKLTTYSAAVGLTPADVTAATAASTQLTTSLNQLEQARTNVKMLTTTKDAMKTATINSMRKMVTRIKAATGYNDSIGQDLGIIGSATDVDLDTSKPSLKAEVFPGYVRISFTKKPFTGVAIYTRLKGSTGWTFLARDTYSPYDDNRPPASGQSEVREYMAIGLDGDNEVGQQSDIISAVFGG
jgi:ribosomal protein L29